MSPRNRRVDSLCARPHAHDAVPAGHYHQNAGGFAGALEVVTSSAIGAAISSEGRDFSQGFPKGVKMQTFADEGWSGFRLVRVHQDEVRHRWFALRDMPTQISERLFGWRSPTPSPPLPPLSGPRL